MKIFSIIFRRSMEKPSHKRLVNSYIITMVSDQNILSTLISSVNIFELFDFFVCFCLFVILSSLLFVTLISSQQKLAGHGMQITSTIRTGSWFFFLRLSCLKISFFL